MDVSARQFTWHLQCEIPKQVRMHVRNKQRCTARCSLSNLASLFHSDSFRLSIHKWTANPKRSNRHLPKPALTTESALATFRYRIRSLKQTGALILQNGHRKVLMPTSLVRTKRNNFLLPMKWFHVLRFLFVELNYLTALFLLKTNELVWMPPILK